VIIIDKENIVDLCSKGKIPDQDQTPNLKMIVESYLEQFKKDTESACSILERLNDNCRIHETNFEFYDHIQEARQEIAQKEHDVAELNKKIDVLQNYLNTH